MKVVILAGGLGTRLSEETELRPKPMVDIGERPILWHIMKSYATQGFKEFFVALGYKGEVIKRYFLDYHGMSKSVTIDVATGRASFHESEVDGRARQAPSAVARRRHLHADLRRRRVGRRHEPAARVPSQARKDRDPHRGQASRPFRRPQLRRRHGH